jgi:hypothetical protein
MTKIRRPHADTDQSHRTIACCRLHEVNDPSETHNIEIDRLVEVNAGVDWLQHLHVL